MELDREVDGQLIEVHVVTDSRAGKEWGGNNWITGHEGWPLLKRLQSRRARWFYLEGLQDNTI